MKNILFGAMIVVLGAVAEGRAAEWILEGSTLTYHVSHTLHETEGISHAAKGKGVCKDKKCDFLVAVPVKSFDSGDSNRDLHMMQVTKAGEFPMIAVRSSVPETLDGASFTVDMEIQFVGQKALYKQVKFARSDDGPATHLSATIPLILTDFKIERPSLLGMPVKDLAPVRIEMTWRRKDAAAK